MADIQKATPGTKISEKARKALIRVFGERHASTVPACVAAKAENPSGRGSWVCVDCGYLPCNNMDAWSHAEKHTTRSPHRFAWRNADSGDWETP
jgi:hypothetical protein